MEWVGVGLRLICGGGFRVGLRLIWDLLRVALSLHNVAVYAGFIGGLG